MGWFIAALTNSYLNQHFDLGSLLVLGAVFQIIAHALRTWLPPFPLYAVAFCFASLGQAYQDTHANTFIASVKVAHRWLGFIHAMYMAGCLAGPFISTAVASSGSETTWQWFYTAPLGLGVINLVLVCVAFREWITIKRSIPSTATTPSSREQEAKREMQKTLVTPNVWLISLYFFFFLGAVITAGGTLALTIESTSIPLLTQSK